MITFKILLSPDWEGSRNLQEMERFSLVLPDIELHSLISPWFSYKLPHFMVCVHCLCSVDHAGKKERHAVELNG